MEHKDEDMFTPKQKYDTEKFTNTTKIAKQLFMDYIPINNVKPMVDHLQVLINQLNTGTAKLVGGQISCTGDVYTIKVKFTIQ
jgi:hypothetical protein